MNAEERTDLRIISNILAVLGATPMPLAQLAAELRGVQGRIDELVEGSAK